MSCIDMKLLLMTARKIQASSSSSKDLHLMEQVLFWNKSPSCSVYHFFISILKAKTGGLYEVMSLCTCQIFILHARAQSTLNHIISWPLLNSICARIRSQVTRFFFFFYQSIVLSFKCLPLTAAQCGCQCVSVLGHLLIP